MQKCGCTSCECKNFVSHTHGLPLYKVRAGMWHSFPECGRTWLPFCVLVWKCGCHSCKCGRWMSKGLMLKISTIQDSTSSMCQCFCSWVATRWVHRWWIAEWQEVCCNNPEVITSNSHFMWSEKAKTRTPNKSI